METTKQGDLLELWSRAHGMAPALRGAALLADTAPYLSRSELARLTIGQRDARLLAMRMRVFGDQVAAVAECPECRAALDLEFRLSDFAVSPTGAGPGEPLQIAADGYDVAFRLPTSEDLACLSRSMTVDEARALLLRRCVLTVTLRGSPVMAADLPDALVNAIARSMGEADPAGEINLQLACPACGHRWDALFDIASFFWVEVDAFVRRRLSEVHELASAYGWAESEILSMPSARRDLYLRMVRGD